ncbi:MAG: 2-oxoacid:ferredoxin oxidoreductase subunit beta [Chloroflexi bacterium]|nr:2-oxoacid:ferredoxin oxidoreductase subunit beta [Chloroflexota bacterium]
MAQNKAMKLTVQHFRSGVKPIWCPGCGDFSVLSSFYKTLVDLNLPSEKVAIASGIGCSGRFPAFVKAYGFHGVHGRAVPLATGMKLARPDMNVFAVGGDGDGFSIGGGHLPHAARRNVDITYIVMDNEIYGLTKGQPSPTSQVGMKKKASPYGTFDQPLNPLLMALSYGTTFVARGFSSKPKQLTELIKQGTQHKGFSIIQVISPCISFNNLYDHFKAVTKEIPEDHDPTDKAAAIKLALDTETIYIGVFYKEDRPTFTDNAAGLIEQTKDPAYGMDALVERYA